MRTHTAAHSPYSESASPRRADVPWIVGRVTPPVPRLRLFCLPQAGGSATSFAPWRLTPPSDIELATVELPGRGMRGADPLPGSIEELADAVLDGIGDEFDLPYAFFGHSFGALLGYELVVRIARRGLTPPVALVVSASRAPHVPVRRLISQLDDRGLREWLDGFGGLPPELARYPAYLQYALRTVRRDLALVEAYLPEPVPVNCPLHVFGGTEDPLVKPTHLERWRDCTTDEPTVHLLPGGHDYLFTGAPAMLGALAATLG
ncbi:thioesterase II family protein [Streptosporangium longisporum]|uniref:Alpha/beta fold hydrolase n=1 Tax=Streptosporangium longisporum TaxID=46187 RepID=A0ABN3Y774_9ACTN